MLTLAFTKQSSLVKGRSFKLNHLHFLLAWIIVRMAHVFISGSHQNPPLKSRAPPQQEYHWTLNVIIPHLSPPLTSIKTLGFFPLLDQALSLLSLLSVEEAQLAPAEKPRGGFKVFELTSITLLRGRGH